MADWHQLVQQAIASPAESGGNVSNFLVQAQLS
jgi:hypothetical protein